MSSTKKLKVNVVAARNLSSKNGPNKNDPYCEVVVLDDQGNKIGKAQITKVLKGTLDPKWSQLLEFNVGSNFSGLKLRCWDKHKFRADKFLGQVTIKFNTALLSSSEQLDDWFHMAKRKAKEEVSGDVHLQIQYGDIEKDDKKARSGTITESVTTELRVSSNFNTEETNNKLKVSTHVVVVEEEEDDEDGNSISHSNSINNSNSVNNTKEEEKEYEKVRDGPSLACLEKISKDDKDIVLSNKNYEVTNNSTNYYSMEYVKGNVRVNSGKWYYEVRIQVTGAMAIGWSSKNFTKTSMNDSWVYDGSRQQKQRGSQTAVKYGEYWSTGDIIGCGIDIDNKTIQYWKNGKDMGVAHTDVSLASTTSGDRDRFCPLIGVSKRSKIQVNFGKDTFAYPQDSYNMLHSFLSEKEIEQLSKLFAKYREIGNQANSDGKSEESKGEEEEHKESIHGSGLLEFQKDLGVVDDDDPILMIIAFKLKTETLWEISREEFMNGFTICGCASIDKIKQKTKDWREELKTNEKEFKQFYNFVFDYLKEDKKILLVDEAVVAWNLVLKDRKWPLFPEFLEFLKEEDKKSISRDAWQQLWHFMVAYPLTLKDYDVTSSWPIIFDEFVEWWQAKQKKNAK